MRWPPTNALTCEPGQQRCTLSRASLTVALSPPNAIPPAWLILARWRLGLTLPPVIGNDSPPRLASAGAIGRMPTPRGSRMEKMFGSRVSVECPRLIGTASAGEAPAVTSAIDARSAIDRLLLGPPCRSFPIRLPRTRAARP